MAEITEQIMREAPEIEKIRMGLLEAAKAQAEAPVALPAYKVAGFTDEQIQALQAGVQGIGSYLPFMQQGAQAVSTGMGALGESADMLRGSDTRGQFGAAQQAMGLSSMPINQISGTSAGISSGIGALYDAAAQAQRASQLGASPTVSVQGIGANQVNAGNIQAAQTGYRPDLQQYQMQGPSSFLGQGTAEAYMSPYMQQVVDMQTREAQRQAGIASTQRGAQAVQAGAFGGARQAIMDAEAQRNLALQLGDIQATGSQAAFQQAQQQFNQEQQALQQARLSNLQAALGVQELGTNVGLQTALANLSADQQARIQNVANQLQAQGMNQDAALRAAMANQQSQLAASQQNAQLRAQYDLTGAQMGQQAAQMLSQAGQGQIGAEAQRAGILSNQAQLYQSLGQGIGSLAGQQFNIGAQMAAGLGSLGTQLGNLGVQQAAMGQTAQQLGQRDVDFLFGLGQQQQRQAQAVFDAERATEMQTLMQPMQNIAFLSDIYKGAPSTQMALTQQATPAPSPFQQVAGLATGAAATAKALSI
jgi:hypothetical protein